MAIFVKTFGYVFNTGACARSVRSLDEQIEEFMKRSAAKDPQAGDSLNCNQPALKLLAEKIKAGKLQLASHEAIKNTLLNDETLRFGCVEQAQRLY